MPKKKKNPDFIVRVAPDNETSLDRKLKRLIYQALGEASVCWDSLESAGIFRSKEATIIGDKLIEDIKDLIRKT